VTSLRYLESGWQTGRGQAGLSADRSGPAVGADAEDLQGVVHVAEAVLGADFVGPALDSGSFDLDRPSAGATDQVMMMAGAAPSVDGLTVAGLHHVHGAVGGHGLKRAIDRRQTDRLALGAQACVQVLGRYEVAEVHEQGFDGSVLSGWPSCGCGHQCLTRSLWVLSLIHISEPTR